VPGSTLHEHPDAGRDGLRRVLIDGAPVLAVARGGELHAIDGSLAELLRIGRERLHAAVDRALRRPPLTAAARLLAPIDEQEVWASGVTYRRSATARVSESSVGDVYELVYDAQRPELFLKAPAWRVGAPGAPLRIRSDSTWDVPEPELALVIDARGEIVGYLAADDLSSRSIEGANPLYLPQAKIYDGACALGPGISLCDVEMLRNLSIDLTVRRSGLAIFSGETSTSRIKRSLRDLVDYLRKELDFPHGVFLMTGTGIVPPDSFTLRPRDHIHITIGQIGTLSNEVA